VKGIIFHLDAAEHFKWWVRNFLWIHEKRNLNVKRQEAMSLGRLVYFSKERVTDFFGVLVKVGDENKFDATRMFNVEQSTYINRAKETCKLIAQRNKHQLGPITNSEKMS
jgi:hypothetical protein